MAFYIIDKYKFELTEYSFKDFDRLVLAFGYKIEKNGFLHLYFAWAEIKHWSFRHDLYSEFELTKMFKNSQPYKNSVNFIIRTKYNDPSIKVNSHELALMLEDLNDEIGMGWEAISECGMYILEFTDGYENMAKSNFEILPNSKVD